MKIIDSLLRDYAAFHQHSGNVMTHFVGIPLIVFGLLAMLAPVTVATVGGFAITAAEVLIAVATVFYLALNLPLALAMLVSSAALDVSARLVLDWRIGLAAFVVGWIFQGIGHAVYEKKSPAFLGNLIHLLVGPLFLLNEVLHVRRIPPLDDRDDDDTSDRAA